MTDEIEIRALESIEDMIQAETLQRQVWPGSETDVVPAHLSFTIAQNGGVILGAFHGDRLIGFVIGFLGTDLQSPDRVAMARLKHCSHQLGVHPEYRNRGVGYRLKVAQRDAVVRDGIRLITWTYDPLLSGNAHINIRLLGAVCNTYLREFYGVMRDGLNMGLPSDRFKVDWWVTSTRVSSRLEMKRRPLDLAHFLSAGAQKLNPATLGEDDLPRPTENPSLPDGNLALVEIPPDFLSIKKQDLELARAWRLHTRELFEGAFTAGYIVTDFIYLKGERHPRSYYILSYGEGTFG
jgi:predicted GNAT superfamily acetyltransferase